MRWLLAVKSCFSSPDNLVIAAILISGFGLRTVGLNVGLPDTPDPREVIIAQEVRNLIHFTAPPQTYNWPRNSVVLYRCCSRQIALNRRFGSNGNPRHSIGALY